jgi:hypothetical protein
MKSGNVAASEINIYQRNNGEIMAISKHRQNIALASARRAAA